MIEYLDKQDLFRELDDLSAKAKRSPVTYLVSKFGLTSQEAHMVLEEWKQSQKTEQKLLLEN